jgi:hypothetical protein
MGVEANPDTNVCNFDKLPQLVAISHILCPLLVIPLTFILIPDLRMTDNIDLTGDGSLEMKHKTPRDR